MIHHFPIEPGTAPGALVALLLSDGVRVVEEVIITHDNVDDVARRHFAATAEGHGEVRVYDGTTGRWIVTFNQRATDLVHNGGE